MSRAVGSSTRTKPVSLAALYLRVLGALRAEARLALALVLANAALAGAQFVEPILFGRIVDRLSRALGGRAGPTCCRC